MASKDIQINGVQYTAVPSIEVKDKAGTGTVLYHEISDTTAAASDVLSGKYFYTSAGVKTQGSIVARTGDQASDEQTALDSKVKLSVPDTAYYGDGANITATFAQVAATNIATSVAATGIMSPLTGGYIAKNRSVLGVAGTFSDSSTISSGQSAAAASQLLTGYSAFIDGDELKGSMPNNGSTGGTISTKAGTITIPAGYTTGGTVSITSAEQNKIIAGNIKDGVTILGVEGTFTDSSTVSSGQEAAAAGDILTGKSAWVNGAEVKGSIAIQGNLTNLSQTGSIPNGYYNSKTYSVKTGSASAPLTITDTSSALSSTDTGAPKITTSITPSVTAGWITSVSTSGTGDKWIKAGSATPSVAWDASSDDYFITSGTNSYAIQVTPQANVSTAGWISSISDGSSVTRYLKQGAASVSLYPEAGVADNYLSPTATSYHFDISGVCYGTSAGWIESDTGDPLTSTDTTLNLIAGSATPSATITGTAVSDSSTGGPTITITPTASVGTAGWIESISNGSNITKYIKVGNATPGATINSSSYLSSTATAYSFTITPTASVGTAGWISSISNGSNVTGYIKAGSVSSYTANTTSTVSVTEGYVGATTFTVPTVTPETAGTGGSGGSGLLTIE